MEHGLSGTRGNPGKYWDLTGAGRGIADGNQKPDGRNRKTPGAAGHHAKPGTADRCTNRERRRIADAQPLPEGRRHHTDDLPSAIRQDRITAFSSAPASQRRLAWQMRRERAQDVLRKAVHCVSTTGASWIAAGFS